MRTQSYEDRCAEIERLKAEIGRSDRAAARRTQAYADRAAERARLMAKLFPATPVRPAPKPAAPVRPAPKPAAPKRAAHRSDALIERLSRLRGKERARALWQHYQVEFRAELADPEKWDLLPNVAQHAIAEAKAAAMGKSVLTHRERRALNFDEGIRYGFTGDARLSVRR